MEKENLRFQTTKYKKEQIGTTVGDFSDGSKLEDFYFSTYLTYKE